MAGRRVVEQSRVEGRTASSILRIPGSFFLESGRSRVALGKVCGGGSPKHVVTFGRRDRLLCDLLLWL